MRSRTFITNKRTSVIAACILLLTAAVHSQRVAILAPERTTNDLGYVASLSEQVRPPTRILDDGMTDAAFRSISTKTPFNMTADEARKAATVIGCEFLLLIRSGELRRTSFSRPEYYEAFAFLYLIDGRSGRMITWRSSISEAATQAEASQARAASIPSIAATIAKDISTAQRPANEATMPPIEEVPPDGSPLAVGLKPPVPYRRLRPEYTELAFLYDVRATIDAEVDVGADGAILGVRFVRWAGYGLEQSVENAIRAMSWRPAMRNGKALPMRILLRYNFTKVHKQ